MNIQDMDNNQQTATQPHPATHNGTGAALPAVSFTEAPASLTIKVSYRGFNDILFTLRDNSGTELLNKLDTVLDRLEKMGATPAQRGGYGGGKAGGSQAATGAGVAPLCPDGHGPMKASTKKPGEYFCPAVIAESGGKKIYCRCKA